MKPIKCPRLYDFFCIDNLVQISTYQSDIVYRGIDGKYRSSAREGGSLVKLGFNERARSVGVKRG